VIKTARHLLIVIALMTAQQRVYSSSRPTEITNNVYKSNSHLEVSKSITGLDDITSGARYHLSLFFVACILRIVTVKTLLKRLKNFKT